MRKKIQAQMPRSEKAVRSVTPALVTALSLLSASLGLAMTDVAVAGDKQGDSVAKKSASPTTTRSKTKPVTQDTSTNKVKTSEKKLKEMDSYVRQ